MGEVGVGGVKGMILCGLSSTMHSIYFILLLNYTLFLSNMNFLHILDDGLLIQMFFQTQITHFILQE